MMFSGARGLASWMPSTVRTSLLDRVFEFEHVREKGARIRRFVQRGQEILNVAQVNGTQLQNDGLVRVFSPLGQCRGLEVQRCERVWASLDSQRAWPLLPLFHFPIIFSLP